MGLALPPPTDPAHFTTSRVSECVQHHEGDLRDPAVARRIVSLTQPEIVIHLAAQALVRAAHSGPVATFATNVMGTANLLEAARWSPDVRGVIVYTSDKVYADQGGHWGYREIDPLGGTEPYGASKAAAEHVVEAYRRTLLADRATPIAVAVLRAGNVIGGGDWAADRLVPDTMRAFGSGKSLVIRHPSAVRPWQHVLEPVGVTLLLGQALIERPEMAAQAWNVGPDAGDTKPVSWLADRLTCLWPGATGWSVGPDIMPYEAHRLVLDSSKSRELLAWQPRWNLDRAVIETVGWYLAHHSGGDVAALSRAQIEAYFHGD